MKKSNFLSTALSIVMILPISSSSEAVVRSRQARANGDSDLTRPQATLVAQLGHSRGITSVAFSPDGKRIVTGSQDKTARLWDVETGKELRRLDGHSDVVSTVAYSPDGGRVVTGSYDKTVRIWEVETGKEERRFDAHSDWIGSVAYSPDGRYVVSGSKDKTARLWGVETGKEARRFEGHSEGVGSVAYSPDGRHVVTGSEDNKPRLWEVETGSEVRRFENDESQGLLVWSVAYSPDGTHVLTGGSMPMIWEVESGKEVLQFQGETSILSVAYSPDGKFILTGSRDSRTATLWNVETKTKVRGLEGNGPVSALAFSPDGKYLVTGHLQSIRGSAAILWEVETGTQVCRFEGHAADVGGAAYSPDGWYLLTGSDTARLWDLGTGREARRFDGHSVIVSSVAYSPDGKYVMTGGWDKTARQWEVETGKEVSRLEAPDVQMFMSVAYSPDGKRVLTGNPDAARLWEVETGKQLRTFSRAGVSSVAYSPDGKHVLTGSFDRTKMELWEAETGRFVRSFGGHSVGVRSIAFSPDGKQVLTASDTVRLWEVETAAELRRFEGHVGGVVSVAFSPDGKNALTSGNIDGTARLWDVERGKELRRFAGHSGTLRSVAFSPNGRHVLTNGTDSTTRFWDLSSGRELCRLISFRDGTWAVVDPDGRFDTNNLEEIKGLHWVMSDDPMKPLPIEIFMRDYYQPKLLTKLLDDIPDNEQFKPTRNLADLNRSQAVVKIKSIKQQDKPELATVTVEVSRARSERQKDREGKLLETDVYDVRLFRDRQIVGQSPDPASAARIQTTSSEQADELLTWRKSSQVTLDQTGKQIIKFENIRLPRRAGASEVEFSAYAFNEDRVKSQTDRKTFELPKGLTPAKGRAYIISVGVNSFENQDWNLHFAANDARLTQRVLFENLTQTGQYEAVVQVPLISDARAKQNRATKANFKAVLDLLSGKKVAPKLVGGITNAHKIKETRPEDLVLISFSSHGYADRNGNFYLFPTDIGKGSERRISDHMKQNLVSSEELSLWLRDVDAGDMVMIIDACNSAGTVRGEGGEQFKPGPMGSRGLGQLAYDKGMRILAASQADDVAIESRELKHGLLTYALIRDGIESRQGDKDKDGAMTLGESLKYAEARVPLLYEEMKKGNVKSFRIGQARSEPVQVVGEISLRTERFQRPSLFDFTRRKNDLPLVAPLATR